jgi:hypothetical protein
VIVEKAILRDMGDNYTEPFVMIGGRWYLVDTKPSILVAGAALCLPVGDDWKPPAVEPVERMYGAIPDGNGGEQFVQDFTNEPEVVAVARFSFDNPRIPAGAGLLDITEVARDASRDQG